MKIQNPSRKIAVIGAGPAGILAATELKDAGYENITIYGDFEEAQCRTKHIDGVVADVGTCYVHSGYFNTIKKLVYQNNKSFQNFLVYTGVKIKHFFLHI